MMKVHHTSIFMWLLLIQDGMVCVSSNYIDIRNEITFDEVINEEISDRKRRSGDNVDFLLQPLTDQAAFLLNELKPSVLALNSELQQTIGGFLNDTDPNHRNTTISKHHINRLQSVKSTVENDLLTYLNSLRIDKNNVRNELEKLEDVESEYKEAKQEFNDVSFSLVSEELKAKTEIQSVAKVIKVIKTKTRNLHQQIIHTLVDIDLYYNLPEALQKTSKNKLNSLEKETENYLTVLRSFKTEGNDLDILKPELSQIRDDVLEVEKEFNEVQFTILWSGQTDKRMQSFFIGGDLETPEDLELKLSLFHQSVKKDAKFSNDINELKTGLLNNVSKTTLTKADKKNQDEIILKFSELQKDRWEHVTKYLRNIDTNLGLLRNASITSMTELDKHQIRLFKTLVQMRGRRSKTLVQMRGRRLNTTLKDPNVLEHLRQQISKINMIVEVKLSELHTKIPIIYQNLLQRENSYEEQAFKRHVSKIREMRKTLVHFQLPRQDTMARVGEMNENNLKNLLHTLQRKEKQLQAKEEQLLQFCKEAKLNPEVSSQPKISAKTSSNINTTKFTSDQSSSSSSKHSSSTGGGLHTAGIVAIVVTVCLAIVILVLIIVYDSKHRKAMNDEKNVNEGYKIQNYPKNDVQYDDSD